jgi:hypothetical protein
MCLFVWLVGWLVGWLVRWFVGWLVGWLVGCPVFYARFRPVENQLKSLRTSAGVKLNENMSKNSYEFS